MIKNLYLIRHAEAENKGLEMKDFDRSLSRRGLIAATKAGKMLLEKAIKFDLILASPSLRTQKTAELIAEQLQVEVRGIMYNDEIYNASARTLLEAIKSIDDNKNTVALIGHNPSITYLAEYLSKENIGHVDTAGIVHLTFKISSWREVEEGNAYFMSYETPME